MSAWVALDDWPISDLTSVETLFRPGTRFITFGTTPLHWSLIRNGLCPAMVTANFRNLGSKAVQFCELALMEGHRFSHHQYALPLRTVSPTNLDEYIRDWRYWATGELPTNLIEPTRLPK